MQTGVDMLQKCENA